MKWPGRKMPLKRSMGRSSRFHLRGFEEVCCSHPIRGGGSRPGKFAYHSRDVHEENDVARSDEQIPHRAGAQKWQRAPRNLDEWDARVLKLESLDNSADGE